MVVTRPGTYESGLGNFDETRVLHFSPSSTIMSNEDAPLPIPNGKVAQNYFVLSNSRLSHLHNEARSALVKGIQDDGQSPRETRQTSPIAELRS